jgi:outer membrane receptor protein involved in Fe transport
VYGRDRSRYHSLQWADGAVYADLSGCYCNSAISAEGMIEGALFALPGGDAKIALGGGYRSNRMGYERTLSYTGDPVPAQQWAFDVSRNSYFGFGEIQLPVVSPDLGWNFVHRLSINGALRYERYPGMASVATPKLGIVYAPVSDVTFKASWGKSFKAPTLYQQYVTQNAWLYAASGYGSDLSPSATIIYLGGGNDELTPERATSWSVSATLSPSAVPGFSAEIGYFNIRYRNRVVAPILSGAGVLDNPSYASLVARMPGTGAIADAIAYGGGFLQNYSGSPYDPANVVAIVDNRNRNVARQSIRGVDAAVSYAHDLKDGSTLTASLAGTYLDSAQLLLPGAQSTDLAGQIYNPPHFRGRAGLSWEGRTVSLSAWLNRIGGVEDNRAPDTLHVRGMTTLDLTARYATGLGAGILADLEFILSVSNAFDVAPDLVRTDYDYYPPYDSTNYSAIGRVISLSVRKKW